MIRWLVVAVVMMTIAMSCLVDRRSTDFECDEDSDCDDLEGDRTCNDGYCTLLTCPSICDGGCAAKTCTINCTNPNECRNGVTCPSGFACVFNCSQDCQNLECPLGCVVNCTGATVDCGPIDCGAGATCSCAGVGTCN